MKQNTVGYLAVTVLCGLIGFTLGSVLLGRLFVCLSAALLLCLVNSALLLASVRVSTGVGKSVIHRGETARQSVTLDVFRYLLPVGEIAMTTENGAEYACGGRVLCGRYSADIRRRYPHVGIYGAGITAVSVTDLFGLFTLKKTIRTSAGQVTVLPAEADICLPPRSEGGSSGGRVRLQEDASEPSSIRDWEDGDSLRRMHWKLTMKTLSSRPETLRPMVKTYEEEERPESLILLDASAIEAVSGKALSLRDGLCDCAYTLCDSLSSSGIAARLLACGETLSEISTLSASKEEIALFLAGVPFAGRSGIERMVSEATRRMDVSGEMIFISAALSQRCADMLTRLSAYSGLSVALVTVTDPDGDPGSAYTARLAAGNVKVLPYLIKEEA